MTYRTARAQEMLAEVRRWNANEWDRHDVAAETYWRVRDSDEAIYKRTLGSIEGAVARGLPEADKAMEFVERLGADVDHLARRAVEGQADDPLDDRYFERWVPAGKLAVRYALTAEVASPWIRTEDERRLSAAYRAADEQLGFSFRIATTSEHDYELAYRFMDELRNRYPGSDPIFDPPHKLPAGEFRIIGLAYIPGQTDKADNRLSADLEAALRETDADGRIQWPPRDWKTWR